MEKRVGFVGCYSHDVILMLAKMLGYTGKRILIRDRNKKHTLRASVPIPEGLCATKAVVEYNGFFFTEQDVMREISEEFEIEIIDFGTDVSDEELRLCTDVVVVTDMLPHHIRCVEKRKVPKELSLFCVMRDSLEELCNGEPEIGHFLQSFAQNRCFFLPPDFRDVRNRYVCETLHEYQITRASPEMQEAIYGIAEELCPEYKSKDLRRLAKRGERRRYR